MPLLKEPPISGKPGRGNSRLSCCFVVASELYHHSSCPHQASSVHLTPTHYLDPEVFHLLALATPLTVHCGNLIQ